MSKERDPIIRSFARVYPQRKELDLRGALNIIMEEILGESQVTDEMIAEAERIAIMLKEEGVK